MEEGRERVMEVGMVSGIEGWREGERVCRRKGWGARKGEGRKRGKEGGRQTDRQKDRKHLFDPNYNVFQV